MAAVFASESTTIDENGAAAEDDPATTFVEVGCRQKNSPINEKLAALDLTANAEAVAIKTRTTNTPPNSR